MSLFGPPNIEKLEKKGDIKGLTRALGYQKDSSIRVAAAKVLSKWVSYNKNKQQVIEILKANKQIAIESLLAAIVEKDLWRDERQIANVLEILGWTPDQSEAGFMYWVGKRNWDKAGAYGVSKLADLLDKVGFTIPEMVGIALALGKIGGPDAIEPLYALLNNDRKDDRERKAAAQALVEIGGEEIKNNDLVKLALFDEVSTRDPDQVVQVLFDQALQTAPVLNAEMIDSQYADVKPRWRSLALVEGTENKIRNLILKNLKRIKNNTPKFNDFRITAVLYARAVQVNTFHGDSFTPIRIWRKDDTYCACGNSKFITS
jgi:hypothetical protein